MRLCCLVMMISLPALAGCSRTPLEQTQTPQTQTLTVPAAVAGQTLVGVKHPGPPPWPRGNCFSLSMYHVANMHAENFKEAIKKFQLETVEILRVGDRHCVIVDERIPKEWLLEKPCSQCTPESMRQELEKSHAGRFCGGDLH